MVFQPSTLMPISLDCADIAERVECGTRIADVHDCCGSRSVVGRIGKRNKAEPLIVGNGYVCVCCNSSPRSVWCSGDVASLLSRCDLVVERWYGSAAWLNLQRDRSVDASDLLTDDVCFVVHAGVGSGGPIHGAWRDVRWACRLISKSIKFAFARSWISGDGCVARAGAECRVVSAKADPFVIVDGDGGGCRYCRPCSVRRSSDGSGLLRGSDFVIQDRSGSGSGIDA